MSDSAEVVIKVEGLNKTFKLPHEKQGSVKNMFISLFKKDKTFEQQHVLKDISFEIKKGEFFGIVGRNGSGKSTLLKLLAGIYTPNSGSIVINGSLTPFIELGVGFNPELTGRENVYLNGALLGFNRKEMDEMYDEIVAFAELSRFMDQKLKNYSSGMQVRLAFSIAIRAKSDILLIDEVLAVGDAAFQKKCFDVFRVLKKEKRTIILVTHDMGNVERFCDRALVINDGELLKIGSTSETAALYSRININNAANNSKSGKDRWGYGGVTVDKVTTISKGVATEVFNTGDDITFKISIKRDKENENTPVTCGLAIINSEGLNIAGPNSAHAKIDVDNKEFSYTIKNSPLSPGEYKLTTALYDESLTTPFDVLDKWTTFSVISDHSIQGAIVLDGNWKD